MKADKPAINRANKYDGFVGDRTPVEILVEDASKDDERPIPEGVLVAFLLFTVKTVAISPSLLHCLPGACGHPVW